MRKMLVLEGEKEKPAFELGNIMFMGTSVISGSGTALVLRTGDGKHVLEKTWLVTNAKTDAFIASIMKQLNSKRPLNSFQRGIRHVTFMMTAFMLVLVPVVCTARAYLGKHTNTSRSWSLVVRSLATGVRPHSSAFRWPLVSFQRCCLPSSMQTLQGEPLLLQRKRPS